MQAQTKKIVIISSVIGVLTIGGGLILLSKRRKLQAKIRAGSKDVLSPAKDTTVPGMFPLQKGAGRTTAEKNAVKVVQRYINAKSIVRQSLQITSLNEDGIFGPLTESALFKLSGLKAVSYSYYQEMQNYLVVPELLSPGAEPYHSTVPEFLDPGADPYDPRALKNDLFQWW